MHSVVREENISQIEKAARVISNVISESLNGKEKDIIAIIGTTDYTHAGD